MMTGKCRLTVVSMLFILATLTGCGGGSGGGSDTLTPAPGPAPTPISSATSTPVGTVNGTPTVATLGAAGATIGTADGKITLTVPAGALAANTLIGIQPITNTAHGGLGAGYRLTPDGQTFAQPVVLKFSYTDADLGGSDPAILGAAFQTAAGFWQWLGTPTIDSAAKTLSISTTHFTDFSMVQGYRLRPLSATLKVNQSLALQVVYCYPPPVEPGDDLTPLGLSCNTPAPQSGLSPLLFVNEWSVNGSVGGNGTVGTVSGNGASATYNAPAKNPSPNTVAVSARVNLGTKGKTLVVSNITIGDSWTGTASFKDDVVNTASAEITWTLASRENNIAMYTATGTGTIAYHAVSSDSTCSFPATSGSLNSSGILFVDYNSTPPTYHGLAMAGVFTVTTTCTYAHAPTETFTSPVGLPVFGGSKGPEGVEAGGVVSVSPDGEMTIEGSDTDGMGGIFNWKFTSSP